jgi:hypothetical protein
MATLRSCTNILEAQQIIGYLRQRGIPAACLAATSGAFGFSTCVVVVDSEALEAATLMLDELDGLPPAAPADWEAQLAPDLSKLPPHVGLECPECSGAVFPCADLIACPLCGAAIDVVELLVQAHGPDALAMCYPEPDPLGDEVLRSSPVQCPWCRYTLSGLPPRGVCPECGETYDKADLLQRREGM